MRLRYFIGKRRCSAIGIAANDQADPHVVFGGMVLSFIHALGPLWSSAVSLKLLEKDLHECVRITAFPQRQSTTTACSFTQATNDHFNCGRSNGNDQCHRRSKVEERLSRLCVLGRSSACRPTRARYAHSIGWPSS
jgi:hypothetical protein